MSRIIPISPNISEYESAIKHPQIRPQSRGSRPLFFFIEINPPKNEAVYIEKKEIGESSE